MARSSSFFVVGLLLCLNANAVPGPLVRKGLGPSTISVLEEKALGAQSYLSDKIQKTAEFVDLQLAGKKYTNSLNNSQVTVNQMASLQEGGVWNNSTDLGVNLRLPNLEKRWQARFSTYDEEREERDLNQRLNRTTTRPKDPGAALYFFRKLGNVRTTFQPRIQLKNPLAVNYVLKFDSEAHSKSKVFRFEPSVQFFADSLKGTGQYVAANFFWRTAPKWEFTEQNEEEYDASGNSFTTRHGVTIDYALNDTQGLGWAGVASSGNHNFHLSSLNFNVSFSHQLIRKLLTYTVSPFLDFGEADSFKGKFGVSLNVEIDI